MALTSAASLSREPWQHSAACTGEAASLFYPPLRVERKTVRLSRERRAKAVCNSCPVRSACLDHAVEHDERYGIWGGLTDKERRLRAAEAS